MSLKLHERFFRFEFLGSRCGKIYVQGQGSGRMRFWDRKREREVACMDVHDGEVAKSDIRIVAAE